MVSSLVHKRCCRTSLVIIFTSTSYFPVSYPLAPTIHFTRVSIRTSSRWQLSPRCTPSSMGHTTRRQRLRFSSQTRKRQASSRSSSTPQITMHPHLWATQTLASTPRTLQVTASAHTLLALDRLLHVISTVITSNRLGIPRNPSLSSSGFVTNVVMGPMPTGETTARTASIRGAVVVARKRRERCSNPAQPHPYACRLTTRPRTCLD
jgi:hypothetical protein